jgi:hypothetical protein
MPKLSDSKNIQQNISEMEVYVVSLVLGIVSKTGFGIFLARLVFLKSE